MRLRDVPMGMDFVLYDSTTATATGQVLRPTYWNCKAGPEFVACRLQEEDGDLIDIHRDNEVLLVLANHSSH